MLENRVYESTFTDAILAFYDSYTNARIVSAQATLERILASVDYRNGDFGSVASAEYWKTVVSVMMWLKSTKPGRKKVLKFVRSMVSKQTGVRP